MRCNKPRKSTLGPLKNPLCCRIHHRWDVRGIYFEEVSISTQREQLNCLLCKKRRARSRHRSTARDGECTGKNIPAWYPFSASVSSNIAHLLLSPSAPPLNANFKWPSVVRIPPWTGRKFPCEEFLTPCMRPIKWSHRNSTAVEVAGSTSHIKSYFCRGRRTQDNEWSSDDPLLVIFCSFHFSFHLLKIYTDLKDNFFPLYFSIIMHHDVSMQKRGGVG